MSTQADIAKHLDLSERRLRDVLTNLKLDNKKYTQSEIRVAYIRHLRDQAAGRGGEEHGALTRARTAEAEASTELKHITIREKAGELVRLEDIEPQMLAMVTSARTELLAMPSRLAEMMRAMYEVDVDPGLIEEMVHAVLIQLAGGMPTNSEPADAASEAIMEAAA